MDSIIVFVHKVLFIFILYVSLRPLLPSMAKGCFLTLSTFFTMAEYLAPEKKQEIFAKYGKSNTDTGSPESQIALFSYRIAHLTEHLKSNKKDFSTRRSLLRLVGKRRRVLDYLRETDIE